MATQSVIHPVPLQKSAVIPINSSVQEIPVAEPLSMTIRAANNRTPGVRTFYVASQSRVGAQYEVQFIRRAGQRRWFCDCGDFKFRKLARKRHCKHIHQLTALVREAHGVSHLVISA